jgi:hypothetical protein
VKSANSSRDDRFLIVLCFGFLLGMATALGVYFLWRSHAISAQLDNLFALMALAVCPPYILAAVANATPESAVSLVLVIGTIVFANGFLYAGVAAGGYFLLTLLEKRKRR